MAGLRGGRGGNPVERRSRRRIGAIVVGVDTGGTFTDLVALIGGAVRVHKVLSTPADPALAVVEGLRALIGGAVAESVTYGSTVATNALLEKKGARVALLTNTGFEDLIEIGRQNRTDIYALAPGRPEPLVARALRIGVAERSYFDGSVARSPGAGELRRLARWARQSRAESFAVCLLHSYANPAAEEAIAAALEGIGRPLSVSHRILAEYREYERLSTTVVNAYVAPRMATHLGRLERQLKSRRLRVMQSDGNAIGAGLARREPVRTLLSGPAAGVVGAAAMARSFGIDRFITFDMGGTSTDVSLFDRRPRIRTLSYPSGYAVRTPVIDIHTVGAGGGSIARIDEGGSLKVGPQSAGADPGPACYGRGERPTVTDADLVAGRLLAENFLGGRMALRPQRAQRALRALGSAMGSDAAAAARGVIRVVNANMERAIRLVTVERGFDPREFALLAFGGAGPMHACELARELGIRHIVLPRNPGLLCAYGALCAPLGREYSLTVRAVNPSRAALIARARPLIERARAELAAEGAVPSRIAAALFADMRYRGQSYEIEVPLTHGFERSFHQAHRRIFGHAAEKAAVEVVNLRVRAGATELAPPPHRLGRARGAPQPMRHSDVLVDGRPRRVPVYRREALHAGIRLRGPLIVVELSATAYLAPGFSLRADDAGNLHLEER